MQEWIPDMVWLNVVALSSMTALHDIPDSVFRNDGLWRQWYDAEAPETANVPDYEDRLSKFERMCVVKVDTTRHCFGLSESTPCSFAIIMPTTDLLCTRMSALPVGHHNFCMCLLCHRYTMTHDSKSSIQGVAYP